MIMLIALVFIFIFCTHCPASNNLASCGQYFCNFIWLLIKLLLLLLLIIADLSGRRRQSPIAPGGEDQSLGTKDTLSIGPVDTHWSHVYINSVRFIYLFIYLGLLILCFVIKVANENVLKLCILVRSHWYYEVFIYMISASYFLGKVAYQVNGFV